MIAKEDLVATKQDLQPERGPSSLRQANAYKQQQVSAATGKG